MSGNNGTGMSLVCGGNESGRMTEYQAGCSREQPTTEN